MSHWRNVSQVSLKRQCVNMIGMQASLIIGHPNGHFLYPTFRLAEGNLLAKTCFSYCASQHFFVIYQLLPPSLPHCRYVCVNVLDSLFPQPTILPQVCWLLGGRGSQDLHPLYRGMLYTCMQRAHLSYPASSNRVN